MPISLTGMQSIGGRTYHSTQETYSPVGRRNLRMYWSGCQSTGAEMRKYLTAARSVHSSAHSQGGQGNARARARAQTQTQTQWRHGCGTYGCQLAAGRQCCPAAGFAERPDLIEKSRALQSVPEVGASGHDGRWETCCAATRPSIDGCLASRRSDVGDVMGSEEVWKHEGKVR